MAGTETTYFDPNEFAVRDDGFEERHYWHIHRKRVLAAELSAYLGSERSSARLIELGCGIGTTTTHLNAEGFRVDYSDVFPRALEIAEKNARRRLGLAAESREFRARDITQPLDPLPHRGALLLDVIEHLPDDVAALEHVRRALGNGGDRFVLVTVPAFQFLWSPWDDIEKHKRRYTRASLTESLETAGFRVERMTFFFSSLFWAALAVKAGRVVRDRWRGGASDYRLEELTEAGFTAPRLNDVMVRVLGLERPILHRSGLPLGTSLLALARAA